MLHAQILDPAAIIQASHTIQAMREAADTAQALDAKAIKTLAKELATIKATMGEQVTLHPCVETNRVLVAWAIGTGTIVRPLAGVSGTIASPVTLTKAAVGLLCELARKLHDHPALAKGEGLRFSRDSHEGTDIERLCLALGTFKAQLNGKKAESCELPQSANQPKASISLSVKELGLALSHVSKSIEVKGHRYWLRDLYFVIEPALQQVTIAACDGPKLFTAALPCAVDKAAPQLAFALPATDAAALLKLVADQDQISLDVLESGGLALAFDGQVISFQPHDSEYTPQQALENFQRITRAVKGESAWFECDAKDLQERINSSLLKSESGVIELEIEAGGIVAMNDHCGVSLDCKTSGRARIGLRLKQFAEALAKAKPGDLARIGVYECGLVFSFGKEVILSGVFVPDRRAQTKVTAAHETKATCQDILFPQTGFAKASQPQALETAAEAPSNVIAFAPVARKRWLGASSMSVAMAI